MTPLPTSPTPRFYAQPATFFDPTSDAKYRLAAGVGGALTITGASVESCAGGSVACNTGFEEVDEGEGPW